MTPRAYVVGDLHLGAGPTDPLEDFRDDDAFARLCERIAGPETTLILNGDVVDFAQIPPFDVPKEAYLLWPASASQQKLATALAAHADFFAGLRRFVERGGRVQFLIGNHDLDMVWPEVQHLMHDALGRPAREQFAIDIGETVFHGVHVEHGHFFTPENCPRIPREFCYPGPGGVSHLERVWGTDFMLQFYNDLERRYPFADNVKPMLSVVWHGLRQKWIGARDIVRLMLFLKKRGVPWSGIASSTLDEPPPLSPAAAANAFDDPEWRKAVLERAREDPQFVADLGPAMAELEPQERRVAGAPDKVEIGEAQLGAGGAPSATMGIFREDRELRYAREKLAGSGVTHTVFGHTHCVVDGELGGRHFNYGTWLPSLNLKDAHVKAKIAAEGITLEMLKDDRLYAVDRRLVRIDADPRYESKVRLVTDDDP